jgi:hypothetical protein
MPNTSTHHSQPPLTDEQRAALQRAFQRINGWIVERRNAERDGQPHQPMQQSFLMTTESSQH